LADGLSDDGFEALVAETKPEAKAFFIAESIFRALKRAATPENTAEGISVICQARCYSAG
jgi:hypothetical protein